MVFVGREHELALWKCNIIQNVLNWLLCMDAVAWVRRICCTTFGVS